MSNLKLACVLIPKLSLDGAPVEGRILFSSYERVVPIARHQAHGTADACVWLPRDGTPVFLSSPSCSSVPPTCSFSFFLFSSLLTHTHSLCLSLLLFFSRFIVGLPQNPPSAPSAPPQLRHKNCNLQGWLRRLDTDHYRLSRAWGLVKTRFTKQPFFSQERSLQSRSITTRLLRVLDVCPHAEAT